MHPSATDQKSKEAIIPRIQSDHIAQMADDLFTTMLAMPFDRTDLGKPEKLEDEVQAAIEIEGDWNAKVRVMASSDLASRIACAMFSVEADDLEETEILDAFAEVVNMIGGNAKGIVDGENSLSLPKVERNDKLGSTTDGEPVVCKLEEGALVCSFACDGNQFTVELLEK